MTRNLMQINTPARRLPTMTAIEPTGVNTA